MKNLLTVVVVVLLFSGNPAFALIDMVPCDPEGCGGGSSGIISLLFIIGGLYVLVQLSSSLDETAWGKRRLERKHQKAVAEAKARRKVEVAAWTLSDVELRHRIYQQNASDPYRSFENREHFAKFADISAVQEQMNQDRYLFGLPLLAPPKWPPITRRK
jgi:hypothetical protein